MINVAVSINDNSVLAVGDIEIKELTGQYNIIEVSNKIASEFDLYTHYIKKQGEQISLKKIPIEKQMKLLVERLGEQVVEKDIKMIGLQQENQFLGEHLVSLELRLMNGGM